MDLYKPSFREHFLCSKQGVEGCREHGRAGHGAEDRDQKFFSAIFLIDRGY
jgi:hypothetical protein